MIVGRGGGGVNAGVPLVRGGAVRYPDGPPVPDGFRGTALDKLIEILLLVGAPLAWGLLAAFAFERFRRFRVRRKERREGRQG